MTDPIERQAAIDAINNNIVVINEVKRLIVGDLKRLPSAQPEQTEMVKEIRKWITSGNRGSADYFIVDKIEEIINKYE